MEQASAAFFDEVDPIEVSSMLGVEAHDFHTSLHPQIISTGIEPIAYPLTP